MTHFDLVKDLVEEIEKKNPRIDYMDLDEGDGWIKFYYFKGWPERVSGEELIQLKEIVEKYSHLKVEFFENERGTGFRFLSH